MDTDVPRIAVADAYRYFLDGTVQFVDTRAAADWDLADVSLPGAIRVPPDDADRYLAAVPPGRAIVTYCS